jgi:hypothetical protein
MSKCKDCNSDVREEWYIPTSYGGITDFCSEKCGNDYADRLATQEGYIKVSPEYPNEMVI